MADTDLNLLVLLDALLSEGSVTHAAARLNISVPAASRGLGRLRRTFGDPVMVRAGQKLVPTPWATGVQREVHEIVASARAVMSEPAPLDLARLERPFSVVTNDLLFPASRLLARVHRRAPRSACAMVPFSGETVPLRDSGYDLAIGIVRDFDPVVHFEPEVVIEPIVTESLVAIAREEHPIFADVVTPARYLAAEHLVNSRRGRLLGPVDHELAALGATRRVVASVSTVFSMVQLLRETDLIGAVSRRVAEAVSGYGLRSFEIPFEIDTSIEICQAWHPRFNVDPAHAWLRQMVREVASG